MNSVGLKIKRHITAFSFTGKFLSEIYRKAKFRHLSVKNNIHDTGDIF